MSEEEKLIVPDSEEFPEKFRGKLFSDVFKSYSESEKKITETSNSKKELEKQIEELRKENELMKNQEPESDPDPILSDTNDYEYMTKKDMASNLNSFKKEILDALKENSSKTMESVMAQMERRAFIEKHPELYGENTEPQEVDETIKQLASLGFASGAKSLDDALEAGKKLAAKLGFVPKGDETPRVIQSENTSIFNADQAPEDEVAQMIKFHKEQPGSIEGTIKYGK
jgi:hypothetical protein